MTDPFEGTIFEGAEVIHAYTLDDAMQDGVLVKKFENRWTQLTGGKPIVATASIDRMFSDAAIIEIWNEYVGWVRNVRDTLPEEDQMFTTTMNGETVWVIDDGAAITVMLPEDY